VVVLVQTDRLAPINVVCVTSSVLESFALRPTWWLEHTLVAFFSEANLRVEGIRSKRVASASPLSMSVCRPSDSYANMGAWQETVSGALLRALNCIALDILGGEHELRLTISSARVMKDRECPRHVESSRVDVSCDVVTVDIACQRHMKHPARCFISTRTEVAHCLNARDRGGRSRVCASSLHPYSFIVHVHQRTLQAPTVQAPVYASADQSDGERMCSIDARNTSSTLV
jgi:hypothetical protein